MQKYAGTAWQRGGWSAGVRRAELRVEVGDGHAGARGFLLHTTEYVDMYTYIYQ